MSFQIEVLKVLAGQPGGRASVAAIKRDMSALASHEWSRRMRALARTAPKVDVFSAGYVVRFPDAWQITPAGYEYLTHLEAGTLPEVLMAQSEPAIPEDFSVEALRGRPQRPLTHYRPSARTLKRTVRRIRHVASKILGGSGA